MKRTERTIDEDCLWARMNTDEENIPSDLVSSMKLFITVPLR